MTLFRIIRILILLVLFAAAAFYTKAQKLKSRSWAEPLEVIIFPINGDNSPVVEEYILNLDRNVFSSIDEFLTRESQKYSVTTRRPTITRLGPVMEKHPPPSPPSGSNLPAIMWWGLKFRYWAFRNTPDSESNLYRIRIFVHYHQTLEDRTLQHSLGLDKGLLAVVHAFASEDQDEQNNIVIAHELLHTVGATDKYDESSEPVFPVGYANPDQIPLYPQTRAEIMTGRIPLTSHTSRMAESLNECIISLHTAQEINWTDRVVQ